MGRVLVCVKGMGVLCCRIFNKKRSTTVSLGYQNSFGGASRELGLAWRTGALAFNMLKNRRGVQKFFRVQSTPMKPRVTCRLSHAYLPGPDMPHVQLLHQYMQSSINLQ